MRIIQRRGESLRLHELSRLEKQSLEMRFRYPGFWKGKRLKNQSAATCALMGFLERMLAGWFLENSW